MQLSELMIGDWVSLFQGKKDGESYNVKITSLWRDYEVDIEGEGCEYDSANPALLFPIHLTEEILKKNRFKFDREDGWWWLTPKIGVVFGGEEDNISLYELEIDCLRGVIDLHLNYVHELQHALRLCGIKEEIVL